MRQTTEVKFVRLANADIQKFDKFVRVTTRPAGQPVSTNHFPQNGQTVEALFQEMVLEHTDGEGE